MDIGPQALPAIRQRFIPATLSGNATRLTTVHPAIPMYFHHVPPTSRRRVIGRAAFLQQGFTAVLQSPYYFGLSTSLQLHLLLAAKDWTPACTSFLPPFSPSSLGVSYSAVRTVGGQALFDRQGVELKTMNVQTYSATSPGNLASGFHSHPSVPDPYTPNVLSNPYAANAVPNSRGQTPAAAPYSNAVSDAYNPHNSSAASALSHDQPHAPAFHSSDAPTSSPQPAAFKVYDENLQFLHTEASAESSQNLPVIMPAIMPYWKSAF
jgi:hypothetical protein